MWSCLCLCLRTCLCFKEFNVILFNMRFSSIRFSASTLFRRLASLLETVPCLPRRQLDINIVSKFYLRCSFMQISHQLTTQQKYAPDKTAFKVGVQTDQIVIKPYPDLLLFFGYGYGSDIKRIRIQIGY